MAKLNKKHIYNINEMLGSALSWHMIYHMQDDQDLPPQFRRAEYQRRKRWKKSIEYYEDVILKRAKGGMK